MRSTALTAGAVIFGKAIGLARNYAKATSEERDALSDYERYDGHARATTFKGAMHRPSMLAARNAGDLVTVPTR